MNIQFQKEGNRWIAEFQVTADFNLHLEREGTGSLRVMQSTMSGGKYDHIRGGSFNYDDLVVDVDFTSIVYPKFIQVISMSEPTLAEVTCPEGEVTVVSKEIEFTIRRTWSENETITCKAIAGMTWREWYNSEYSEEALKPDSNMESSFKVGELELCDAESSLPYSYFWREFVSAFGGDGYGLCYNNFVLVNADKPIIAGAEYIEEYTTDYTDI